MSDQLDRYISNSYTGRRSLAKTLWDEDANLELLNKIRDPNISRDERLEYIKQLTINVYSLVMNVSNYFRTTYLSYMYDFLSEEDIRDDILYLTSLLIKKLVRHDYDLSKGSLYTYLVYIIKKQTYYLASEDIRQKKHEPHFISFSEILSFVDSHTASVEDISVNDTIDNYLAYYDIYTVDYGAALTDYLAKMHRLRIVFDSCINHILDNIVDIIDSFAISIRIGQDVYLRRLIAVTDIINSVFVKSVYDTFLITTNYISQEFADSIVIDTFSSHYLQYYSQHAQLYDYVFKDPDAIKSDYYRDIKNRVRIIVNNTRTLYSHENRTEFNTKVYDFSWELYKQNLAKYYLS